MIQSGIDIQPVEVAILDAKGDILLVNKAWREFADDNHGLHETYWEGENYFDICKGAFEEPRVEHIVTGMREALDGTRDHFTAEYPCHSPQVQRWFQLDASGFSHENQPHLFLSHTNITERKRAELQAESRMNQLETLVGVLSHDLRNPLNIIQGYAQMVADDLDNDDRMTSIINAAARISEITEATLQFVKSGSLSDIERIELRSVAAEAWANVDTKSASIDYCEEYSFHGDRPLILQIFENLLRNAVEHAGADCTVRVGKLENGFYVEDDGSGVPESLVEKILESDFSTGGSGGLGLAIIQSVVQAHGATLAVKTSETGGARFEIDGIDPVPVGDEPLNREPVSGGCI